MYTPINFDEKLGRFTEQWSPKISAASRLAQDGDEDGSAICDIGAYEFGVTPRLFLAWLRR